MVASLAEALCYKPAGRRFETRLGNLNVPIYLILPAALGPVVYSASNRIVPETEIKENVSGEKSVAGAPPPPPHVSRYSRQCGIFNI
jgi:glutamine synthetase